MRKSTTPPRVLSLRSAEITRKASFLLTGLAVFASLALSVPNAGAAAASGGTKKIAVSGNLSFGNVAVGSQATRTLTISNAGSGSLIISSVSLPAGFTGTFAGTLKAGRTKGVAITFRPTIVQSYSGTATVNSDATNSSNTLPISGVGTGSRAIALSGSLAFGSVAIGSSAQRTLVISNSGTLTLTVSNITFPTGFSGSFSGPITVGHTQAVTVTFSPVSAISYGGTVTVISDKQSGTNTITASGTGTIPSTRVIALGGNLAFGNVLVGSSSQRTLFITNTGNSILTISNVTYPTGFSGNFLAGKIAAGAKTNVTVTFSPVAATGYSGSIVVTSDATSGANSITASGTGTNAPTRVVALSGNLNFGNALVGSSPQMTLFITNSGNSTMTVSGVSYPTGFSGNFTAGTIPAGAKTNVTVTFSPVAATSYSGSIVVTSDATSGANSVTASGTGTNAPTRIIGLSGNVNFSNVIVGTTSQLALTISNSGNSALTVTSIVYPTGFSGDFAGVIAAGATTNVTVTFSPVAATGYSGTVTVNSDATSGLNSVTASGTGIAVTRIISLSGDLDFDNVQTGGSAQLTLTITNTGNSALTISSVDYPSKFSGAFAGVIAPGATTNVTVTFSPVALTTYSGTITVNSDATVGVNTVNVTGNGVDFTPTRVIALSGDLDFGDVEVGFTQQMVMTISNGGNSGLQISSISYPTDFSGDFSAGKIESGGTTNVTITFAPLSARTYNGVVTVTSDATSGGNTINVMGDAFHYIAAKARFDGLFYPANDLTVTNSGSFTSKTSLKQTFSAKIQVGGKKYGISGIFSASGAVTRTVLRTGLPSLTVTLQAGFDGGDVLKGTVSDGVYTSKLVSDRLVYNKTNPAPEVGTYSMVIAGGSDILVTPTNNSTGGIGVNAKGGLKFKGQMADGTKAGQSTIVTKNGQWPFFAPLNKGGGMVIGWVNFTNDPGHEITGNVDWVKLPATIVTTNYPAGFFLETTVSGARIVP